MVCSGVAPSGMAFLGSRLPRLSPSCLLAMISHWAVPKTRCLWIFPFGRRQRTRVNSLGLLALDPALLGRVAPMDRFIRASEKRRPFCSTPRKRAKEGPCFSMEVGGFGKGALQLGRCGLQAQNCHLPVWD